MKKSSTLFIVLLLVACSVASQAQRNQRREKFKPSEVSKMPVVLIDLVEKSYPRAHLQKVTNSSITIIKKTVHEHTLRPMYFSGEVQLDQIESIVLISKKRRLQTNLIGAAVGGVLGYFVGNQIKADPRNRKASELFYRRPLNVEPILGGIIGVGLGAVIGDLFTPLYIDNVNRNPKQAISKLKEYAPSRKSKKRKRRKRRR